MEILIFFALGFIGYLLFRIINLLEKIDMSISSIIPSFIQKLTDAIAKPVNDKKDEKEKPPAKKKTASVKKTKTKNV